MALGRRLLVFASIVACVGAAAVIAQAATKRSIKPVQRSNRGALALGKTIMVKPQQLIGARFNQVPPKGTPVAIGRAARRSFAGFPRNGSSFALLSNGCATKAGRKNTSPRTSCYDAGRRVSGTRDTTILGLRLRVPKSARCLSFRFRFLSEEYPEWVHSKYNDAFIAEWGKTTWHSVRNAKIYAPRNFAKTKDGHMISIHGTGVARVSPKYSRGTTYDAGTRLLRASTPVKPGTHVLYLSIFDQGDRQYDSTVFVDQLTLDRRSPCKPGVAAG